jgi:2-hydroxy-6-oxonona-2,4-dienedioate hydrolase
MDPATRLAQLLSEADLHTTPCGQGELTWQQWSSRGVPLVLLHGGFGSWNHWLNNIEGLRQQRSLWTLDLPGLGDSAAMPEPHTPSHFSQIILKGLDALLGSATHFELAGFSFGAMIGARVAQSAGSRCQRFTAIGAAGFGALHHQVSLQRPPSANMPPDEAQQIHHSNLRALMFSSEDCIDDLAVYAHGSNLARHRFNSRRLSLANDFIQALPDIQAPLVGVWGSRDATAGGRANIEKRRELFLAAQADAEFHILDGVGHWAMYEAPSAVNAILLAGKL